MGKSKTNIVMSAPTVKEVNLNKPVIGQSVPVPPIEEKVLDKPSQMNDTVNIDIVTKNEEVAKIFMKKESFVAQVYAYVPYYNETRKKYDMFKISIDPSKDATVLERIELRHDSHGRAIAEMQQMYAKDHLAKTRAR